MYTQAGSPLDKGSTLSSIPPIRTDSVLLFTARCEEIEGNICTHAASLHIFYSCFYNILRLNGSSTKRTMFPLRRCVISRTLYLFLLWSYPEKGFMINWKVEFPGTVSSRLVITLTRSSVSCMNTLYSSSLCVASSILNMYSMSPIQSKARERITWPLGTTRKGWWRGNQGKDS